ncbi:HAD-IA family hydrolase [Yinghuangia soli]|uniref:HAD-IA family hydrolase n=1 Tax=Yinghuangia soli TaxID=2908204 RepID=A0AA41TY60_9ACTN|nr:HAD-IA family hydrolase [Yinghuangia soli]MCF2526051.1 HAD-IA family hydrolase [Yinghuangia soli]
MAKWLVFDYGEVICHASAAVPAMAASVDAPLDTFHDAYWALRDAYDRGMSDTDYWTGVGERAGFAVDAARVAALTEADIAGWLHTAPESLALLDDLTAAGVPLALLSNAPASCGRAFTTQPWAKYFRHLVISADHGIAKPDAEMWRVLTERLDASPADCAFLDDRQVNIDGALAAGLSAHLWTGHAPARTWLAEQGILAAR